MNIGVQLHSNGEYWQAKWRTTTGKRVAKSIGSKAKVSKAEALRACREIARDHILEPGSEDAGNAPLLSAWRTAYLKSHSELKEGTVNLKMQTFAKLLDHFGDIRLDRITRAGAAAFRTWMLGKELSAATVSRYIRDAKSIFREARDQDLIRLNPFDRVSGASPDMAKTWAVISHDDLRRLLDAVPDAAWRALVGMCRLAGLRRGEALRLRVQDVDLVERVLSVYPEGFVEGTKQAYRTVPITPALAAILRESIDAVPDGEERLCWSIYGRNVDRDIRTYLGRAGIPKYGKPLHTLRKNLESEWLAIHPAPAVCAWLGHSPAVAMKHYNKPPPEVVAKVTGLPQPGTNLAQLPTLTDEKH
jgi:integrase